ncbi:MAG: M12 family metallo-peptidase [Dokdonella sp.]
MRTLLTLAFLLASTHAVAASDTLALQPSQLDRLKSLAIGESIAIDDFPDSFGGHFGLRFQRIDVYANGARILAVDASGERELPRSKRVELIASDSSGTVRAYFAFDPGFKHAAGAGSSPAGAFAISTSQDATGARFIVKPARDALPPGIVPQTLPGNDSLPSGQPMPDPLTISLAGNAVTAVPRGAVIAVDVDHELLVNRFGGTGGANLSAATSWIADLFATMNVMYVRDLNVSLQQGTTIFRTVTTPYAIGQNTSADGTDLGNFGTYWQNNEASVQRDFVALLSGRLTGGFSASGIAWINAYCVTSANGGSYSINKVFTSSQVPVDLSARIVGHELGHNFGAAHTHCTNASSGAYPASSNTIDKCSSGESVGGGACYSGATSCPATGPGAPAGSIMSYCNLISCGPDHQNVLQFHPTQITTLSVLIAQHTPSCLNATADLIFKNGFD